MITTFCKCFRVYENFGNDYSKTSNFIEKSHKWCHKVLIWRHMVVSLLKATLHYKMRTKTCISFLDRISLDILAISRKILHNTTLNLNSLSQR